MGDNWQEILSRKHRNSKAYDVSKISKSVFITNFPDCVSARELWKTCSVYETVVDVFIPSKKSKAGKRFAFVRFIKVFNLDRLVANLSTIWIGKLHLIANHVRYERLQNPYVNPTSNSGAAKSTPKHNVSQQTNSRVGSYAKAVNSGYSGLQGAAISPSPAMVLDDSCLVERDLSMYAMGKVKDFSSIPNLYSILNDEGFSNVKLSYLGGTWVLFEFSKTDTKVDIEGVPLNAWTRETFSRIENKWGVTLDLEENADNSFGRKRRMYMVRAKELFTWNPTFLVHEEKEYSSKDDSVHEPLNTEFGHHPNDIKSDDNCVSDIAGVPETEFGSSASSLARDFGGKGASHSEDPFGLYKILKKNIGGGNQEPSPSLSHPPGFTPENLENHVEHVTDFGATSGLNAQVMSTSQAKPVESNNAFTGQNVVKNGGSFLEVMEDMIRVGQVMGYSMEGCEKDLECIIEKQGEDNDYISVLIGRWNGDVVIMGDFNEVRSANKRRGSMFYPSMARCFNNFISSSGLVDIKLEGFSFTWSHPSASKLSKLDRFLVSEDSNGMIRFKKKLYGLKIVIRNWVKSKKHHLSGARCSIKNELSDIDKDLDRGGLSDSKLHRRMDLLHQLHDIDILDSKDFIQKSKIKWAVEGDENSKFFHGIINKKRSQLAVRGVFVDGLWVADPCKVKDAFLDDLEKNVTRDEIRMAVWSCGENKSPGPDEYSFEFFRKYWNIVGIDFCEAVEYFFLNENFPIGCNASFIALIPKVMHDKFVSDYRPISLIGCIYKVVTKVLSNRLAPIISYLVSDTQSEFVANRQILDGPFILSEVLSWCKRKKKQSMFFKVDFAKAYDSVHWDFLLDVLQAFGFGPNWCKWIRGTFSNAMASILVNGSPSSEFQFYSGLKQGDPLSPYLFILIMESLHFSFSRVVNEGIFKGISLNGKSSISHLFYADDAMFIGEWSEDNLKSTVSILKCFFLASGLKINFHKSQVLGVGVPHYLVEQAANSIGCSIMDKCFRYLGVKVGESTSRHKAWSDLIQKLRSRLSKWKVKTLSIGGRLTLLKSVLGASPIYNMFIYKAAWNKVLEAKKNGGLGVSSFHAVNRALLFKWVWRFVSQDGSLWNVRDGVERQQFSELISMLESVSLSSAQDRWCCDLSGDGEFRVKDIRNQLLKNLFTIPCFNVPWPSLCSVRFLDGGICLGKICRRFQIGLSGSQLSVSLITLRRCWKVFSILCGGLFGCFVIVPSFMLRLQDDRLSLMILFPYPLFGVLVDVIGCSLGNIG
nr:RNA-directed DNA polymerase, eukaryota [Tanacetum cinerariifolium]